MSLILTILNKPNPGQEISSAFQTEGTIGRAPDNTWVLVDPERFTSSKHAQITSNNGDYFITDTSTNGVFVNGAATPLGKGNSTKLNHGDKLKIGQYEISVTIQSGAPLPLGDPDSSPFGQAINNGAHTPFGQPPISTGELGRVNEAESLGLGNNETLDPLSILGGGSSPQSAPHIPANKPSGDILSDLGLGGNSSSPFGPANTIPPDFNLGTGGDNASPLQQQFEPPAPAPSQPATPDTANGGGSFIPDDWQFGATPSPKPQPPTPPQTPQIQEATPPNEAPSAPSLDDLLGIPPQSGSPIPDPFSPTTETPPSLDDLFGSTPQHTPPSPAPIENMPHAPQPAQTAAPVAPAAHAGGHSQIAEQLLAGMGLSHLKLSPEEEKELALKAGQLVHTAVQGLVTILRARASIKSEFRMSVTTIQAKENNPLKFSPTGQDALNHMFSPSSSSYMSAIDAVNEGFNDMEAHMIAMMAGMQSALHTVLMRFDPSALEREFEQREQKRGFSFASKKAKHWDVYNTHYKEIIASVEDDFHTLFGDEFSRAYEEQVAKLKSSR